MSQHIVEEDIATISKGLGADVHKLSGKTVLISGGGGFLGKYIVGVLCHLNDTVLEKPCRIISVDNYITGYRHPHFDYRQRSDVLEVWADITYPLPLREEVHFIIHAAGLASPAFYRKYPLETIETTVSGVKNLLELARKNPHLESFLFFSSSEIYGDPDPSAVPTPETYFGYVSSIGPRACYDESKRLGETLVTTYHELFGTPAKIARPFNVFGPGLSAGDKRVMPMFAHKLIHGEPLPVHGDGHQTRTFCYVTDGITGFLKILLRGRDGEAYNIGNEGNETNMEDLAKLCVSIKGGTASYQLIKRPDDRPAGGPLRRCPDVSKARAELEYVPTMSLKDSVERFIHWCEKDPDYLK